MSDLDWKKRITLEYGKPWREVIHSFMEAGVTQRETARILGIAHSTIRKNYPELDWPKTSPTGPIYRYRGKTVSQWAGALGVSDSTIRHRIKTTGSPFSTESGRIMAHGIHGTTEVDPQVKSRLAIDEGVVAAMAGKSVECCPYGLTKLNERNSWLAGYRDTARGLQ